jgi:hypothetical protein
VISKRLRMGEVAREVVVNPSGLGGGLGAR